MLASRPPRGGEGQVELVARDGQRPADAKVFGHYAESSRASSSDVVTGIRHAPR